MAIKGNLANPRKFQKDQLKIYAVLIPMVNGNANFTMSLSSVISSRIFAKIAIIFLTLRGLTLKFAIINPIS